MFMNEGAFDDDAPSSRARGRKPSPRDDNDAADAVETLSLEDKRPARASALSSAHPNSLKDEEDLDAMVDGDDYLSGSRSNVIQQQRDLHKKKLQERMGGGKFVQLVTLLKWWLVGMLIACLSHPQAWFALRCRSSTRRHAHSTLTKNLRKLDRSDQSEHVFKH